LRAAFAARAASLRPGWYVVGAAPAIASCPSTQVAAELDALVAKLASVSAPVQAGP
jgi:hypothetical protein